MSAQLTSFGAAPRKRVLVIDDNTDDLLLLQLAARRTSAPIEFSIVRDGRAAIEHFQKHRREVSNREALLPDLVLLDLRLPKRDGFEVLRWIRETPGLRALKVFIWTGSENPADRELAKKLGVDLFLSKSTDERPLVELISGIAQWAADGSPCCQLA
jgi:CheY-like chemotaxis protein